MHYHVEFDVDLKRNPYKGLYIAVEGIDGSGKTTQVDKLTKYFEKLGREVVRTHEPRRDGVMGKLVQEVLEEKTKIPAVAIQYLFAAQRAVHLEELVIPSLEKGAVVVTDRCFWSSIPYGLLDRFESGKDEKADRLLASLSVLSMYHGFITPDATFILDVSIKTASQRLAKKTKAAELYEKKEKLNKIKKGYSFLLSRFSGYLSLVNAEGPIDDVTARIIAIINKIKK